MRLGMLAGMQVRLDPPLWRVVAQIIAGTKRKRRRGRSHEGSAQQHAVPLLGPGALAIKGPCTSTRSARQKRPHAVPDRSHGVFDRLAAEHGELHFFEQNGLCPDTLREGRESGTSARQHLRL